MPDALSPRNILRDGWDCWANSFSSCWLGKDRAAAENYWRGSQPKEEQNGCSEQAALRRATNLLPGQDHILTPPVCSALTMNSNTGKGGLHRL